MSYQAPMTSRWLKRVLPPSVYKKAKELLVYRPNDPLDLRQVTPQFQTNNKVERIKGFRYPSPGSVHEASVVVRDSTDGIYDTKNYPRNPENLKPNVSKIIHYIYFHVY